MIIYLLDAAGAGLLFGLAVIFLFLAVLTEAVTLSLAKYNPLPKSFLHVLIINIVSLLGGYVLVLLVPSLFEISPSKFHNYLFLYAITVALEFPVLWALNRTRSPGHTLRMALLINLVSYVTLYVLVQI